MENLVEPKLESLKLTGDRSVQVPSIFHGVSPQIAKKRIPLNQLAEDKGKNISPVFGGGFHPNFTYHGGYVVNTPQVINIFLGNWSGTANQNRANRLVSFTKDLISGPYMNILSQYGCGNHGNFLGSIFLPTTQTQFSDSDFHTFLQNEINIGNIKDPANRNTVYLIFLDDSMAVNSGNIVMCEPSSDNAFGYHNFFKTRAGHMLYYAIIPSLVDACIKNSCPGGDNSCSLKTTQTREQRQTQVISHEFAEMVSDPELNAWFEDGTGSENGDICNGQAGTLHMNGNSWDVQLMYSKIDDLRTNGSLTCIASAPSPTPLLIPLEINKVTLGDTSDQAPSITFHNGILYLAWSGSGNKEINVMSSSDGIHFGNKITMADTSAFTPVICSHNNHLFIAWTGTDGNHSLNIIQSADGIHWTNKVTLGDNSIAEPALASFNGKLFLGWTGTDGHHSLNVMESVDGIHWAGKITLADNSFTGPSLVSFGGNLIIGWTGTDSNHSLNIMQSADGIHFTNKIIFNERSDSTTELSTDGSTLWISWSGTPNRQINFITSPAQTIKITLGETSTGAPAIAYPYFAWTGTDGAHHLNVGRIGR